MRYRQPMGFRRGDLGWQLLLRKDALGRIAQHRFQWDELLLSLLFHVIVALRHLGLVGERRLRLPDVRFISAELFVQPTSHH